MKTKWRFNFKIGLALGALVTGLSSAEAQFPRATPMSQGNEKGLESFETNVFPLLKAKCAMCHNVDNESVPWHANASDPKETYLILRRYVTNWGDLKNSKLVASGTRSDMAGASLTADDFVMALRKWWDKGENTAFFDGKKVLPAQKIPALPKDGGFVPMTWDLGEVDPRFKGIRFEVEIQKTPGAYLLRNPKIDMGKEEIEIQGIHLVMNGIWNSIANNYASVHTVVPQDGILSHADQIVLAVKGEGVDELAFAFEKIEPSTQAMPSVSPDLNGIPPSVAAKQGKPSQTQVPMKITAENLKSIGATFDEKKVGKAARFVRIEASPEHPITFEMGSPPEIGGVYGKEDRHFVEFKQGFEIQATLTTQLQWYLVMGTTPSYFKDKSQCDETSIPRPEEHLPPMCKNHPVEQVTWAATQADNVQEFISRLNRAQGLNCGDTGTREGFAQAYRTPGCYRLLTEAEWEYVAHAGLPIEYAYGWGNDFDGQYAWYNGNSQSRTHEVATRAPTVSPQDPHDLLWDMAGNVWEWVNDWYGDYLPQGADPKIPLVDPMGPPTGSYRVLRGGSWYNDPVSLRAAQRYNYDPGNRGYYLYGSFGFRLARTSP